jgi:arsenite-transporting ATPase
VTRVLLVTGSGGAGRSTVAAATALAPAEKGLRTLLLHADGPGPSVPEATTRGVDVLGDGTDTLVRIQDRLGGLLTTAGVEPLEPDEATLLPGAADLFALRALAREARSGDWDVIVADLPAVDRTTVLLALPESLGRHLDRLLPVERQAARSLRPMLAALAGVPMPDEKVFAAARTAGALLGDVREVLDSPLTSVRLVLRPDTTSVEEARRAAGALSLYGQVVSDVVVNGLLPAQSEDPWLQKRAAGQRAAVTSLEDLFGAVVEVPAQVEDITVAETADFLPAVSDFVDRGDPEVERDGEQFVLVLPLPGVVRTELDLLRRGDELIVTVGPHRRLLPLPSALRRCDITGAGLRDGALRVRFTPDPAVWPRRRRD